MFLSGKLIKGMRSMNIFCSSDNSRIFPPIKNKILIRSTAGQAVEIPLKRTDISYEVILYYERN
jgi:hypothetical protein